jgi:AcrR family transcriptional regulator
MRAANLREETYETILEAAARLFHRYGYRKMTMCDVAEEARLSRPTVYLYFANKEELALGVIDRLHRDLNLELEAIAAATGKPEERLRQMLIGRVLFIYDRVPHDSQSLNDLFATIRPTLLERRDQWLAVEGAHLAQVLVEGQEQGLISVSDPRASANVLMLATNSLLPFYLSRQELGSRSELTARAEALVELLLHGILSRG